MEKRIIERYVTAAKRSDRLKLELAERNEVTSRTIYNWLRAGDEKLMTPKNLAILAEHFGIKQSNRLLEEYEPDLS